MDSARLKRQAIRWQRQASKGEMPEEVYETMASGATGIEKRQVANLAKASNIFDKTGEIRIYNDFKQDWHYEKSIFAHGMATCQLCGKYPIREQCVLKDEHRPDKTIIVGNTCVERYIEISVDGNTLDGEEKAAYLRGNMKEAKHTFQQEKFAIEHPDAMSRLKKYEEWMNESAVIGGRWKPIEPKHKKMQRAMVKRLVSHGYPGPKLWKQWNEFLLTADEGYSAYEKRMEEKELRRQEAKAKQRERAAKFAEELNKRRNGYSAEADAFRSTVEFVNMNLDDWERTAAGRAENTIRTRGKVGLSQGMTRLVKAIEARASWQRGDGTVMDRLHSDPVFSNVSDWLKDLNFLNGWERKFCTSIRNQIIEGKDLSEKQDAILRRLVERWQK
jgi:hypothetical protein